MWARRLVVQCLVAKRGREGEGLVVAALFSKTLQARRAVVCGQKRCQSSRRGGCDGDEAPLLIEGRALKKRGKRGKGESERQYKPKYVSW